MFYTLWETEIWMSRDDLNETTKGVVSFSHPEVCSKYSEVSDNFCCIGKVKEWGRQGLLWE